MLRKQCEICRKVVPHTRAGVPHGAHLRSGGHRWAEGGLDPAKLQRWQEKKLKLERARS